MSSGKYYSHTRAKIETSAITITTLVQEKCKWNNLTWLADSEEKDKLTQYSRLPLNLDTIRKSMQQ